MLYLKQSTASQSVMLGPFIDDTDGKTAEVGLTIANTDIRLSKNGANIVAKNSGGGTHDELGYYTATFDATDTDTVGRLQVMVHVSGALPVYHEFEVVEEAIYVALFAASATGALPVSSGGIASTAFASGAITATGIAANAIGASELAADAVAEIADAVWDELQSAHVTAGSFGEIATEIASILADTNELQGDWTDGGRLDLLLDAIKAVTDLLNAAQSEPTGVPAANETPLEKLGYLFMALRNKVTVTATKKQFFDDGGAAEWEKDLSDDGTTYTESEGNAP